VGNYPVVPFYVIMHWTYRSAVSGTRRSYQAATIVKTLLWPLFGAYVFCVVMDLFTQAWISALIDAWICSILLMDWERIKNSDDWWKGKGTVEYVFPTARKAWTWALREVSTGTVLRCLWVEQASQSGAAILLAEPDAHDDQDGNGLGQSECSYSSAVEPLPSGGTGPPGCSTYDLDSLATWGAITSLGWPT
jgi:hypothetical protein